MKQVLWLILRLTSLSLVGCVTTSEQEPSQCLYATHNELHLRGEITPALVACVKSGNPRAVETLIVNSEGGAVQSAIDIADLLPTKLDIIIEDKCNSSCANFFIPLANRLILRPNSMIGLHGSIDAGLRERHEGEIEEKNLTKLEMTTRRQTAFARKHNIHPGWLLKRTANEYETQNSGAYMVDPASQNGVNFGDHPVILVNTALLESCFPDIAIEGLSQSLVNLDRLKQIEAEKGRKLQAYPSNDLICLPMDVSAFYQNSL